MKNIYISIILGTLLLIMLTECLVVVTLHLALQCMVAPVVEIQIFCCFQSLHKTEILYLLPNNNLLFINTSASNNLFNLLPILITPYN